MIAKTLQRDIESIYRLDGCPSIDQFLISTDEFKKLIPSQAEPRPQVLLREDEGEISLAVHLGEQISWGNLKDFLSAVEEISHFVYLTWSAHNERPVSLLDIETQGEIDKFLLANQYFPVREDLFERLFENIAYVDHLAVEEMARYKEANRLGGKFVKSLGEIFDQGETRPEALCELRSFYRKSSSARLASIDLL